MVFILKKHSLKYTIFQMNKKYIKMIVFDLSLDIN